LLALIKANISLFLGGEGAANGCDIRITLSSLFILSCILSVKPTHAGTRSKHTCADVTRAACGLTSVFKLEPYQKGAPASVAAWYHSPQWLLFRPHVPQPQATLICVYVCVYACVNYLMPAISNASPDQGISMSFLRIAFPFCTQFTAEKPYAWADGARCDCINSCP